MARVSYHFKVLKEADCITLVKTRPVRGATASKGATRARASTPPLPFYDKAPHCGAFVL